VKGLCLDIDKTCSVRVVLPINDPIGNPTILVYAPICVKNVWYGLSSGGIYLLERTGSGLVGDAIDQQKTVDVDE
jgi:hypothetical protein